MGLNDAPVSVRSPCGSSSSPKSSVSDAGRAWKAELFCDIELLRQEQGPQLVEVEGLSDFEKLWCDFP